MKTILLFSIFLCHLYLCRGNNILITNISLTGQNTDENFTMVEFDISWENSWRVIGGPNNWDAAWVFIKYKIGTGPWLHAGLNNAGHMSCGGTSISNGLLNPALPFDAMANPGVGIFLYRSDPGSGTLNCENVQLRWNYGANGLSDNEQINIKVFAIEHVYIPQGAFKIGDGSTFGGGFHVYDSSPAAPYAIGNEGEIAIGTNPGNLYYLNQTGSSGDQIGPLPASFPKGYNSFYVMKYEISQQSYADFLNTLTRTQQSTHVRATIGGFAPSGQYVMANSTSALSRNSIWTFSALPQNGPILFYCNLNANEIGGEADDGQNIACNFLNWADVVAYLDWAGLRPITELEYEKAGRGPVEPLISEYAWGDNFIRRATTIINAGLANEMPDTLTNCATSPASSPYRVGSFARSGTDRTFSGATYYGALDFTGNLWEQIVSIGDIETRAFEGHHGDGLLPGNGIADVIYWPMSGSILPNSVRGGSIGNGTNSTRFYLSNRELAYSGSSQPPQNVGGRGGRTAPL